MSVARIPGNVLQLVVAQLLAPSEFAVHHQGLLHHGGHGGALVVPLGAGAELLTQLRGRKRCVISHIFNQLNYRLYFFVQRYSLREYERRR